MKQNSQDRLIAWGFRIAGGTAVLLGALWLVVWLSGSAARLSAAGVIIPKTNMALCQLLGGAALLLLGQSAPNRSRRLVGAGLALFVLCVGTLTLSEHLLRYDLGIDQLLAAEAPGAAATVSPNRMGPLGSTSLALLGAGLLALALGRRRFAPHFGLAVCLINLVPAVGFLYGIDEFFSMPRLTGIALPTVVVLLALGGGMVLAHRESGPLAFLLRGDAGSRLVRRMLPVVIIIPLAIGWLHSLLDRRGLLDGSTSDGALVLAVMLLLSALLWRSAVRLSRSDAAEAEAVRAVARSNQKLAQVLDSIQDDFYVLNHDWNFVYASRQLTSRFGKEPKDFVGSNFWKMFPKHVGSVLEENFRATMEKREVRRFEMRGQYTDAWYIMTSFPSPEGITVLGTDITERKKAETLVQALAEQERLQLGAAVEQASDSVVMVDLDGRIRYVNAAFESLQRTPRDKAIDRSYFDFLAGQSPSGGAIREAIALGRPWHGQLGGSVPGGSTVELDVTISPAADSSGKVVGGLITEKDVTQENVLQRQVRQAQKMEALGTLAGGITHDFNNILGSIIINTELALLDLDPASPARWPLPLVLQAANRGKELVKQIITFSRQRAWERKPLEIVPVIKEGTKFLRSTLPKEIRINEAIDSGSGVVLADPSHIHQILVNLCQNAALAMPGGPGRIEVNLRPVEVDAALAARHSDLKPGRYVRLTVADSGCGMSQELMERIFEPFFTTRKHGEGSGLGLAVVQGIVKSYEGTIVVSSEPGKGSVFDVYIPRLEGEALAAGSSAPRLPANGRERVLLVEDEEAQRTSLTRGLEHLGYKVTARADGRTALANFQKEPSAFDIVITDQIMPRLTGLELAEALAKIRPDIPIILCTGFSEKVDGGTVGQNGIRELLMKPFTLQEITQAIRAALKK